MSDHPFQCSECRSRVVDTEYFGGQLTAIFGVWCDSCGHHWDVEADVDYFQQL